jgi:glycosyltransferase involved in cell wall biosynthesis
MATYEPDPQQLSQQLESLKRQTYQNWTCVISDDASSSVVKRQLADQVDGDPRFTVLHHTRRVGFYRNFETCLTHVPSKANLVAFCDQDDRWHADKLETLVETIRKRPETMLVYSDMRLVNASGRVLRDSLWGLARRNNATDLGRLMCANSVTGAASLFRRELLAVALPFPNVGAQYHDHWLAILALATGDLTFVSRPLHDYVQHARNVVGARGRPRSQKQGRFDPERWYFTRVIGGMIFAREALARAGAVMAPEKRRVLERIALLDGVSGLSWLAGRAIRHPAETRAIKMIAGDLWRRTLSIRWPGNWQVLQVSDSALPARIVPLGG